MGDEMVGNENPLNIVRHALKIARIGAFNDMPVRCTYGPGGFLKIYYGTPSRCLLWAKVSLPVRTSYERLSQKTIQSILATRHTIRVEKLFDVADALKR